MEDVTKIDFTKPYGKISSLDVASQTVFYTQNGIDYGIDGMACDEKQVKEHYAKIAAQAQADADAAKQAAEEAQKGVDALIKQAGVTKTAVKKAAKG